MGKKKHKRERQEAERRAEAAASAPRFDPAPFASMAAAALERVNTPEVRTMMAGVVGAALQGLRRPPEPPRAAAPPVPPSPPAPPAPAYRATVETPAFTLPPETAATIDRVAAQAGQALEGVAAIAASAIETAAAAVERWAAEQQGAFKAPRDPGAPPHDR